MSSAALQPRLMSPSLVARAVCYNNRCQHLPRRRCLKEKNKIAARIAAALNERCLDVDNSNSSVFDIHHPPHCCWPSSTVRWRTAEIKLRRAVSQDGKPQPSTRKGLHTYLLRCMSAYSPCSPSALALQKITHNKDDLFISMYEHMKRTVSFGSNYRFEKTAFIFRQCTHSALKWAYN